MSYFPPTGSVVSFQSDPTKLLTHASVSGNINVVGNPSISGTVQIGNFPTNQNVSGSVVAFISGTVPVNATGSVVAFQGAGWSGSVAAIVTNSPAVITNNASVITITQGSIAAMATITSIATANGALPIFAPLTSRIQGVADLRVVQGASVAAIAAQGAGVRAYIDHVQVVNFGSSSVLVYIADNTTSTLGWTIAPAGGGSNYNCFYRPAANSPITASISGIASVLVSLQGFTSSI